MVDGGALAVCLIVPIVGGMLLGFLSSKDIKTWYASLTKPSWNPPNWLFGPVWTVLYAMMGYASYAVYEKGGFSRQAVPLGIYIAQLVLNFLWTPLFFTAHRLDVAFVDIALLWGMVIATIATFYPVIGPGLSLGLLLPYLAWVSFASCLNFWLWRHNADKQSLLS
ncbi:translocator [Raphidocelis subcapitata]|uniref:Translocator n=1 Tax=Raphidocelis subcapitata TaxID=307507 RepID=A0A2V0P7P6_9CHLO|nr:translocator [Raphidocelis subcapitata]|eukprot:GBF93115.1 translocator [Raphidocelis subcapitata]